MVRARLSAQRALLGEVSPALRAVVLSSRDRSIDVECFFDGAVSAEDEEGMWGVEAEMMADCYPGESVAVHVTRSDAPSPIDCEGMTVYRRRE